MWGTDHLYRDRTAEIAGHRALGVCLVQKICQNTASDILTTRATVGES
jgi:hypothetical protein